MERIIKPAVIDFKQMEVFIENVLKEAGELLRSAKPWENRHSCDLSGEKDLNRASTKYDLECERFLIERIRSLSGDYAIVSEESANEATDISKPTWIIDPIDGTLNFIRGLPYYCISVSYWENGSAVLGGIYWPALYELFTAQRGAGAKLNGVMITVSKCALMSEALVLSSGMESFKRSNREDAFRKIGEAAGGLRILAASALDMCMVASGRAEARIYGDSKIWDMAAAGLILTEAGGMLTNWEGQIYSPYESRLIASNGLMHDQIVDLLYDSDHSNRDC